MAISIKNRNEFITQLFDFFRIERTQNLVSTYDLALTTKFPVDWEALYEDVIKSVDKRTLPMPKYLTDKITGFKKISEEKRLDNESIIRVILKSGQEYIFTVNNSSESATLKDVKRRLEYKDENKKTKTKIQKIIRYPKETTIMGDNIFFNVNIPKNANMTDEERERRISAKEKELESQVKLLYVASADS